MEGETLSLAWGSAEEIDQLSRSVKKFKYQSKGEIFMVASLTKIDYSAKYVQSSILGAGTPEALGSQNLSKTCYWKSLPLICTEDDLADAFDVSEFPTNAEADALLQGLLSCMQISNEDY